MAPCTGGFRKTNAYEQKQVHFVFIFIARQMYNCSISVVGVRCEILFV